jgi:aspartate aminotransferase
LKINSKFFKIFTPKIKSFINFDKKMNTKKDDSYISKRAAELKESATLAMSQKTRELKSKGIDVINLSIGEPDFFVPNFIKEAAKQAIDDNYSFYPPVAGYPELRQMISHKLKRDNKLDYEPSQVVVSNGAKHAIANIFLAIINEGDEVLIPAPYWVFAISRKDQIIYSFCL